MKAEKLFLILGILGYGLFIVLFNGLSITSLTMRFASTQPVENYELFFFGIKTIFIFIVPLILTIIAIKGYKKVDTEGLSKKWGVYFTISGFLGNLFTMIAGIIVLMKQGNQPVLAGVDAMESINEQPEPVEQAHEKTEDTTEKTGVTYNLLGFPHFEGDATKFSAHLPKELYHATDLMQAQACVEQLQQALDSGELSKDIFTARQLADIQQGKLKIHELVWHHHEVSGKMELVSSAFHTVPHVGGRIIWGHKEQPVEPQYSDETVSFIDSNDEVPIASVREIEQDLVVHLPEMFKVVFSKHHGSNLSLYRFQVNGYERVFGNFLSVKGNESIMLFMYRLAGPRILPAGIVPFAIDPFGNLICFCYTSEEDIHPQIVFWRHEEAVPEEHLLEDFDNDLEAVELFMRRNNLSFVAKDFDTFISLLY